MKIVVPTEITTSKLIDTNIPVDSDGLPEWDDSTTYELEDRVQVTTYNGKDVNLIFEYVGTTPSSDVHPLEDDNDPPVWLEVGKTNRWRAFDKIIGTQSSGEWPVDRDFTYVDGPTLSFNFAEEDYSLWQDDVGLSYTIRPDMPTDTLSVFNVSALRAFVRVVTNEGLIYSEAIELGGGLEESSWYSYFFSPLSRRDSFTLSLPLDADKDIEIAFIERDPENVPEVGEIVVGRANRFGATRFGTSISFIDFSRKERDNFGNFQVVERGFADTLEIDVSLPNEEIPFLNQTLKQVRASPTVWIGGECYPDTIVYGYLRDYEIVISGPSRSDVSVSVEGLV